MSERAEAFELLLRQALAPVDPPVEMERRVEEKLGSLVEAAAEELETWELSAMRDPRNWVRPVAAVVVGSGAAVGLVVLRAQRSRDRRRRESHNVVDLAERTVRDLAHEANRLLDDARRRRR